MSIKDKKRILTDYYRKHGGLPKGNLDIDADTDTGRDSRSYRYRSVPQACCVFRR